MTANIKTLLIAFASLMASPFVNGQQLANLGDISDSYKGGFFRMSAGIAPGNFGVFSGEEKTNYSITTVHFDFTAGKRLNKAIAPYFNLHGNVLIKETNYFSSFSESGMSLGSNLYFLNPTTYIAPQIGLSILNYEENGGNDYRDNLGANFTLKTGWDRYLGKKVFFGVQLFLTYYFDRNMDDPYAKWNGTFYGVNLSLNLGK